MRGSRDVVHEVLARVAGEVFYVLGFSPGTNLGPVDRGTSAMVVGVDVQVMIMEDAGDEVLEDEILELEGQCGPGRHRFA